MEQHGIVLSYQSNFYTVRLDEQLYQCVLKGNLKKEGTEVLVGDRVLLDTVDEVNLTARIVTLSDRRNALNRPKVANVDQALIVVSTQSPPLSLEQLDRYITQVQLAGIEPWVCISKMDLAEPTDDIDAVVALYKNLNIPVFTTRIDDSDSVTQVFSGLKQCTVVLAGLSGVGKSSLLNAYLPELNLKVGEVSEKSERGQHTTRHTALISIGQDTFVADSPGFSYLKFDTTLPAAIEAVFQDFAPFRQACHFQNCLHLDELDCAVQANLDKIAPSRYQSYGVFQEEAKAYSEIVSTTSQKDEYGTKTFQTGKHESDRRLLKLKRHQRQASRRVTKQQIANLIEDEPPE